MPKLFLKPHPDTPQSPIRSIAVEVGRRPGGYLGLSFRANGATDEIEWPGDFQSGNGPWTRADGLWEHSCFEAFGTVAGETGYFEVNLATSGKWAAYAFLDRREGMRTAEDVRLIAGNWRIRPDLAELHALLEIPAAYRDAQWILGLTAVIEAKGGRKSWWALRHPPGKPDFHHPDSFACELP